MYFMDYIFINQYRFFIKDECLQVRGDIEVRLLYPSCDFEVILISKFDIILKINEAAQASL